VKLDKETPNIGGQPLRGRTVDEGVCGILVSMNGEPGNITLFGSNLSSSYLVITTGPDKTGYELVLIKEGQRR
jgi:hypothetical protein